MEKEKEAASLRGYRKRNESTRKNIVWVVEEKKKKRLPGERRAKKKKKKNRAKLDVP